MAARNPTKTSNASDRHQAQQLRRRPVVQAIALALAMQVAGANAATIDAGDDSAVPGGLIYDQRGTGFDRIFGGSVDLRSVEVGPPPGFIFSDSFE